MTISPLAALIVKARRDRTPLPLDPALAPASLREALDVQAQVAQALDAGIAGWKVGFTPEGAAWAAPIFATDMLTNAYALAPGEVVKVEGELGVRFARDLPPRPGQPYAREEIVSAISEVFAGLELVASRFADPDSTTFLSRIGDSFSNLGYVIGTGVSDFSALDLSDLDCQITFDSEIRHHARGGHANRDPLVPLIAWANEQISYLGGMRAGQFLTTGTLNRPIPTGEPAQLRVDLASVGSASLRLMR